MKKQFKKSQDIDLQSIAQYYDKELPMSIELEKAVLGAAILEKNIIIDLLDILKPESFAIEAHQEIFSTLQHLSQQLKPIDILTVTEELTRRQKLDFVGGSSYLAHLTLQVGSGAHAGEHAKVIVDKFIQRELVRITGKVQKTALEGTTDVAELLDTAQQDLFVLAEGTIKKEAQPMSTVVDKVMKLIEEAGARDDGLSGVASGFKTLDTLTLGWQPGDLIIVAARPSMGKTAFVLSMARNMTVHHKIPLAFFSLEMGAEQLVSRLFVSESNIDSKKLKTGKLTKDEYKHLNQCIQTLAQAPMFIDDTPALSIFEFRSKARRLRSTHKIECIVIDYLQLMVGPPETRGMREQEVSSISRSLKAIAKEIGVPILALSQLNRSVETRGGTKRPQLSDLRESGAIEQDADLVTFIHRPEYYGLTEDEEGNPTQGVAEIIVAKHRNGATDTVRLRFRKEQARFCDLEDDYTHNEIPQIVTYSSKLNSSQNSQLPPNDDFGITPGGISGNPDF